MDIWTLFYETGSYLNISFSWLSFASLQQRNEDICHLIIARWVSSAGFSPGLCWPQGRSIPHYLWVGSEFWPALISADTMVWLALLPLGGRERPDSSLGLLWHYHTGEGEEWLIAGWGRCPGSSHGLYWHHGERELPTWLSLTTS